MSLWPEFEGDVSELWDGRPAEQQKALVSIRHIGTLCLNIHVDI